MGCPTPRTAQERMLLNACNFILPFSFTIDFEAPRLPPQNGYFQSFTNELTLNKEQAGLINFRTVIFCKLYKLQANSHKNCGDCFLILG